MAYKELSTENLEFYVGAYEDGKGDYLDSLLREHHAVDLVYELMTEVLKYRREGIDAALPEEIEIAGTRYVRTEE